MTWRFKTIYFERLEFWPRWFGSMISADDKWFIFWLWRFHFVFERRDGSMTEFFKRYNGPSVRQ